MFLYEQYLMLFYLDIYQYHNPAFVCYHLYKLCLWLLDLDICKTLTLRSYLLRRTLDICSMLAMFPSTRQLQKTRHFENLIRFKPYMYMLIPLICKSSHQISTILLSIRCPFLTTLIANIGLIQSSIHLLSKIIVLLEINLCYYCVQISILLCRLRGWQDLLY